MARGTMNPRFTRSSAVVAAPVAGHGVVGSPVTAPLSPRSRATRPLTAALCMTLGALALVAAQVAPARAQFSVEPAIVQVVPTDSARTSVLHVTNQGNRDLQLRFYASDYDQSPSGAFRFGAPGTLPHSCRARLSVYPDGALVPAGHTQDVRVTMQPGDSTCWALVFAENVATTASGLRVGQRIGVRVYGVPASAKLNGEVTSVAVRLVADTAAPVRGLLPPPTGEAARAMAAGMDTSTPDSPGAVPGAGPRVVDVSFVFRNAGEMPIRTDGYVELRTLAGRVVGRTRFDYFSVLPGHDRDGTVRVRARLAPGRYLAVPVLDFGADYLAGGQAVFDVK